MSSVRLCTKLLVNEHRMPTSEEITQCMEEIMSGKATPAQVGGFLIALSMQEIPPHVLVSCAKVLRNLALQCPLSPIPDVLLDVVGTGGDSHDTFNVSTASAFVAAACGTMVTKHGNRSSSGRCGSADFIEALGANIRKSGEEVVQILKDCNFTFLFAQQFHPAMGSVSSVRKELGVRTIFNILGPLINPTRPSHMLIFRWVLVSNLLVPFMRKHCYNWGTSNEQWWFIPLWD
eukprot:TRINITY_DN3535_c0_g1_i9.p1 TRINITY_DN3535_c0_g1~~TRINITY_DN3535_c0_g1_i9.p1  ORF type:complete len:233 (+),score=35.80 TRINITY_DN3535_c0_g1_i9:304-1002(+)